MPQKIQHFGEDRRRFLKVSAAYGGALALGSLASKLQAAPPTDWSKLIGIQLTVVRDEMAKGVEPTLAKLAEIGYKTVNPVGFSGLDARTYRAMLDRHGLIAPQIDLGFNLGDTMEKDLEACQILGIKFAEPNYYGPNAMFGGPAGGRGFAPGPPRTEEQAKRSAADHNGYGRAARKFGIQVIYHNHADDFELLKGSKSTFFDVFLAESDPELVGIEFDLGYTAIAGRDIMATIRQYPGRFPTWDIRDYFGVKNAGTNPAATPNQRRAYGYSVPAGLGEVDFKTIFSGAETSGLKYFFVIQDNSTTWGDSMATARISFQNLAKILA